MTERSRRAFLAAATGALAATAGCSRLPSFRNGESDTGYETDRLRDAADPDAVSAPATHPGPVPTGLADAHYERAQALLDPVGQPAIPNGAVAEQIAEDRERAAEALAPPPTDVSTLDALRKWRADRADAAAVRGAYVAATGDANAEDLRERREAIRSDLRALEERWAHRGRNVVEAVAVHWNIEDLVTGAGDALVADRPFPVDPKAAVFDVGSLARGVENARAQVSDAAGLRDAYADESMTGYAAPIATAATKLEGVTRVTARRVDPYLDAEADIDDFERDIEGTPAAWLFIRASGSARYSKESAASAVERDDYATGVVQHGRALVAALALESAVAAIRDGEHGTAASTDAVLDARERAFAAVREAEAVEPRPLADALTSRARSALHYAEQEFTSYLDSEQRERIDRQNVANAAGSYAYALHAAKAVPPVVERVSEELRAAARGDGGAGGT